MNYLSCVRMLLLGSVVLFGVQGCGDGNIAVVSQDVDIDAPMAKDAGAITIALKPNTQDLTAKAVALLTLPTPTNIRLLVSHATTGFSAVQDVTVPMTSSVTIPVPVANGYTLEIISYAKTAGTNSFDGYNNLLKYNIANDINVTANTNTSVDMTLLPLSVSIGTPNTVEAGGALHITGNIPSPLQNFNYLQISTSPFTNRSFNSYFWPSTTPYSGSPIYDINAPTASSPGTLYFQGIYFMNSRFLTSSDTYSIYRWLFIYPNHANGDAQVSTPFTIPTGGITLGVNY